MKLKLKGRWFDTIEIQAKSPRQTLTEKDFQEAFKNGGDGGTGVCMREGTTSRVMAGDRPYGEFYDFYSVSPEYFGYSIVCNIYICQRRACVCCLMTPPIAEVIRRR
jgi:hypothetical protein